MEKRVNSVALEIRNSRYKSGMHFLYNCRCCSVAGIKETVKMTKGEESTTRRIIPVRVCTFCTY